MGNLIGPLLGGYAGATIGFSFSFLFTGSIFLLIALVAYLSLKPNQV